jgi:hypothetical protein
MKVAMPETLTVPVPSKVPLPHPLTLLGFSALL